MLSRDGLASAQTPAERQKEMFTGSGIEYIPDATLAPIPYHSDEANAKYVYDGYAQQQDREARWARAYAMLGSTSGGHKGGKPPPPRDAGRICGLRERWFWALAIFIVMIISAGAGAGIGVGASMGAINR